MRTCYIHIGMPKTGSTSIQNAFLGYADDGLEYARIANRNHTATVVAKFTRTPEKTRALRLVGPRKRAKLLAMRRAEFDATLNTDKSLIYSGEGIARQLGPGEIAEMLGFFRARFDRVVVIAYVRPMASLVGSQFQQEVKMGRRRLRFSPPLYRKTIAPILKQVAREDLHLVRFDRKDLIDGDIVRDFAHRVGAERVPAEDLVSNTSLSAEAVGAMMLFNRYIGRFIPARLRERVHIKLSQWLQGAGAVKFGLGTALIEAQIEKHADEIAWLEQKAGFDMKGEIKTVPDPIEREADLARMARRTRRGGGRPQG